MAFPDVKLIHKFVGKTPHCASPDLTKFKEVRTRTY